MARKGLGQTKTGRSRYAPFVRLDHAVIDHAAFRGLDAYAVQALVCLCRQYKGPKGSRIMASVRWVKNATGQSHERAWKSLATLERTGFIVPLEIGHMGVEGHGTGTVWRLTFLPADGVGESHDYRAKWEAENSEPRYAAHNKGRSARRNKGRSGNAASVTPDVTRKGPKTAGPVMPDVTTSKTLPGGTPPDGLRVDDRHAAQAVAQRLP